MLTLKKYMELRLRTVYPARELQALLRIVAEDVCRVPFHKLLIEDDASLPQEVLERAVGVIDRLSEGEPIQYILGYTEFRGMKLSVAPGVLIPRPETSALVDWVLEDFPAFDGNVLDIGTGSGCIALALRSSRSGGVVWAADISPSALEIARRNGEENALDVRLVQTDILDEGCWENLPSNLRCIVSNPPYVMEKEQSEMAQNVLRYEPPEALFVPDDNPLLFYRAIARFGKKHLSPQGKIYVEINEKCGESALSMFKKESYRQISLRKDLFGKDRMIKAEI